VIQEVVSPNQTQAVVSNESQVQSQTIPDPVISPVMTTPVIQQTTPAVAPVVVTTPVTTNTVQIPTVTQPPIVTTMATVATIQPTPSITIKK